jgi:zinc transporter ZupT
MYYASSMIILFAFIASVAAFAGGVIAMHFRDKLHIILGLSAGAVIGASLFDLIPESVELAQGFYGVGQIMSLVALGFFIYLILDRIFSFHEHVEQGDGSVMTGVDINMHSHDRATYSGSFGAASFCIHSLIDGIAIGLSFQIGSSIGLIVAAAVVAHRFSDGINTIGVIIKHQGKIKHAWGWLIAVAVSPIFGAILTLFITVREQFLAILLAIFAGFFLYIGASDLIPEGKHSHSKILTTIMTIIGAVVIYYIVHVANI